MEKGKNEGVKNKRQVVMSTDLNNPSEIMLSDFIKTKWRGVLNQLKSMLETIRNETLQQY
jgi:hypothetical protein